MYYSYSSSIGTRLTLGRAFQYNPVIIRLSYCKTPFKYSKTLCIKNVSLVGGHVMK